MIHLNLIRRRARRPRATKADIRKIIALHATGLSASEVAAATGRERHATSDILQRRGLSRSLGAAARLLSSKSPRVNHVFFDTWTVASAWCLGLLFGDGHIQQDSRTRHNTIYILGDEQVTRAVGAHLGHQAGSRRRKLEKVWEIRWNSVVMVESLVRQFGLFGNKSARVFIPEMPEHVLPHFIRGLWDADGHWEAIGNHVYASYVSISERLIDQLQALLGGAKRHKAMPRGGTIRGRVVHSRRPAFELVLRRDETRRLVDWIYSETTADLRCERKFHVANAALHPALHSHSMGIPDPATRTPRQRITRGEVLRAVDLYKGGHSSNEVGAILQRDARAIREHLTREKVIRARGPGRPVTQTDAAEMVRLYQTGLSSNDVAGKVNRDGRVVRKYLTQAGVMRDHVQGALLWRHSTPQKGVVT